MGSVSCCYQCSRCNGVVYEDYNYKTNERFSLCISCGKVKNRSIKRDKNNMPILDEKNEIIREDTIIEGYGTVHFAYKDGVGSTACFKKPITENDIKLFYEELENNKDLIKEECRLIKFDTENRKLIPIYGDLPKETE